MAGSKRVSGTTFITTDNLQLPVRGNVNVSLSKFERTGVVGLDATHGYQEKPRIQFIEVDLTTTPELSLETLEAITNATVTTTLANGQTHTLFNAWTKSAFEINAEQGQVRCRFEGMNGSQF